LIESEALRGESLGTWWKRLRFNFFPAYWGTGAKVTYISEDLRTIRIKLPLNFRTRNIYGTLFGGAMYAAIDPLYPIIIKVGLGSGYDIWDKAGSIRYFKPGRSTLFAECSMGAQELAGLKARLEAEPSVDVDKEIELVDAGGVVHAVVQKTIYVARKGAGRRSRAEQDSGRR
jgi:acyl-coenzyme A thioesterase PaaI-like protein